MLFRETIIISPVVILTFFSKQTKTKQNKREILRRPLEDL